MKLNAGSRFQMMKDSGSIRLEMLDEASLTRQPEEVRSYTFSVLINILFFIMLYFSNITYSNTRSSTSLVNLEKEVMVQCSKLFTRIQSRYWPSSR